LWKRTFRDVLFLAALAALTDLQWSEDYLEPERDHGVGFALVWRTMVVFSWACFFFDNGLAGVKQ
jgi:hypothetical protein